MKRGNKKYDDQQIEIQCDMCQKCGSWKLRPSPVYWFLQGSYFSKLIYKIYKVCNEFYFDSAYKGMNSVGCYSNKFVSV